MTATCIHALTCFIVFMGAFGLMSGCQATKAIDRQIKLFRKNTNPLERNITSDTPPEKHAEQVEAKLKELRQAKKISGRDHLSQRLEPMIHISKQVDSKLRLPSLDDLHELSLEYEFSRTSVCLQSSIQATVLILGICGTLWGVHIGIGSSEFAPQELKVALRPGMAAVTCTVLLTISKGIYMRTLNTYMSILDRYTIDTLVPCMQPVDAYDEKMEEMAQPIENLRDGINMLNSATQRLKISVNALIDTSGSVTVTDTGINELQKLIHHTANAIESNARYTGNQCLTMERLSDELRAKYERLTPCSQHLQKLHKDIIAIMQTTTERLSEKCRILKATGESSDMELTTMGERMMNESELRASMNQIGQKQQKALSTMANKEKELLAKIQQIRTSWEDMRIREKRLDNHLDELVSDISSTKRGVEKAQESTEKYRQKFGNTITSYRSRIKKSIKKMQHYPDAVRHYIKLVDNRIQEYGKNHTFRTFVEITLLVIFLLLLIARIL